MIKMAVYIYSRTFFHIIRLLFIYSLCCVFVMNPLLAATRVVFLLFSNRKCHGHFSGDGGAVSSEGSSNTAVTNRLPNSKLSVQGGLKGSRSPQPQRPTHLLTPTSTFPRSSPIRSASASPSCATSPQNSPGASATTTKRFCSLFLYSCLLVSLCIIVH